MPDVYRHAASVLVLRKTQTGYELLLVHKPRKRDSWQLPQGGIEKGETVRDAALRELREETSLVDCTVLGVSERVYQYDFPPSFRRFRPDNVRGQKISYVFAAAPEHAKVTVDKQEIDAYVWVNVDMLPKYLKRKEYLALVRDLYHEALNASPESHA